MFQVQVKTVSGFTLIELMVAIAIMAILVSIATPSYQSYIQAHQTGKIGSDLFSNLRTLRQTAISQASNVVICASTDQTTCSADVDTANNWAIGWIAFMDLNENNQRESVNEDILILQTSITDGQISLSSGGILSFDFRGEISASTQFNICAANNEADLSRAIIVNKVGRVQMVKPRQLSGAISCS
ncbi:GspH/FimT family pseudopilin [Marinicellulosiphila megalodicopiae]|uniref:GspH/FimT family pseudopilin n=1 Tax=Marinicellulosiphila megalodicopiae TaxID=2724896 RepID=UPI003BAF7306